MSALYCLRRSGGFGLVMMQPVLMPMTGDEGLIGQFVDVKITGANKWSLSGEPA